MKKIAIMSLLAITTTFSLFAFMAFLISNDNFTFVEPKPSVVVEIAKLPDEKPPQEKPKPELTPPPKPPVMPKNLVATNTTEVKPGLSYKPIGLVVPKTTLGLGNIGRKSNSDARPVVRVNPKYPIIAARDGIEGWVVLAFDINAIGEVVNIKIVESEPKRIFDKAAKQALKKWKYRAKSADGQQVLQQNLSVKLDFSMSEQT